jgi:hypothetical protein
MLKFKRAKADSQELFEAIKENLHPSEKILYEIDWEYIPLMNKIMRYMSYGSILFVVVFMIIFFSIFANRISIFNEFISIFYFVVPFMFVLMILFMRKVNMSYHYLVAITNKKLYLSRKMAKIKTLDSINLSAIKGVIYKPKSTRSDQSQGAIIILSDELPAHQKKQINLNIVNDLDLNYNAIESILWQFGDINQRWDQLIRKYNIQLPYKIKGSELLIARLKKTIRIFNFLTLIFLLLGMIGLILLIFVPSALDNTLFFLLIINFLLFGFVFSIFFYVYKYRLTRIIPKQISDLIIESTQIKLAKDDKLETISLQEEIPSLDFVIAQDLKRKTKGTIDINGLLIIRSELNSPRKMEFGPIEKFEDFFELIFLYLLKQKYESKSSSIKIPTLKDKYTIFREKTEVRESAALLTKDSKISEKNYNLIKNYVNPEEKLLFEYNPDIKLLKYIIFGMLGIFSFIGLYIILSLTFTFSSLNLFIIGIFTLIFPIVGGMLALCLLPGMVMEKRAVYMFTDQKIIIKYQKKFLFITYSNIKNILKIKRRKKRYNIELNLKTPLESSPYIDKNRITILNVLEDTNLIEKIKLLIDTHS